MIGLGSDNHLNFRDEKRLEFVNVENKFKDSEDDEENTWKTVKRF